jgi:hypothetical protein
VRSTFGTLEIECYRVILGNPGCTTQQVIDRTYFNDSRVRKALLRLYNIGAIGRERDGNGGPSAPYRYVALRGTEPLIEHQRAQADRHRLKQVADGHIPTKKGLRRNKAKGWLMSKAEWEALFVNYELARPGQGDLIIAEHLDMRLKRGEPPELDYEDMPRLMAEVGRRRRLGRQRLAGGGLTPESVRDARARFGAGETISALAREYGVTWDAMSKAVRGKSWREVT